MKMGVLQDLLPLTGGEVGHLENEVFFYSDSEVFVPLRIANRYAYLHFLTDGRDLFIVFLRDKDSLGGRYADTARKIYKRPTANYGVAKYKRVYRDIARFLPYPPPVKARIEEVERGPDYLLVKVLMPRLPAGEGTWP